VSEVERKEKELVACANEEEDGLPVMIRVCACLPCRDNTYWIIIVIVENTAHVAFYRFVTLGTGDECTEAQISI
jgi:hypothetical protein